MICVGQCTRHEICPLSFVKIRLFTGPVRNMASGSASLRASVRGLLSARVWLDGAVQRSGVVLREPSGHLVARRADRLLGQPLRIEDQRDGTVAQNGCAGDNLHIAAES